MSYDNITFATFCECNEALNNAVTLVASIREFAGKYSGSDVLTVVPTHMAWFTESHVRRLQSLGVRIVRCETPSDARLLFYGDKPFAAATAEICLKTIGGPWSGSTMTLS